MAMQTPLVQAFSNPPLSPAGRTLSSIEPKNSTGYVFPSTDMRPMSTILVNVQNPVLEAASLLPAILEQSCLLLSVCGFRQAIAYLAARLQNQSSPAALSAIYPHVVLKTTSLQEGEDQCYMGYCRRGQADVVAGNWKMGENPVASKAKLKRMGNEGEDGETAELLGGLRHPI